MRRGRLAFVFAGTWIETLPMAHELIHALQDDGWTVDVYNLPHYDPSVPESSIPIKPAFPHGRLWPWKQGLKWFFNRPYDGYIGSCVAGIWCASVWARLHQKPLALLSDEIYVSGSNLWRRRERLAHQRCEFTIVPDLCRWDLLKGLNRLPDSAEVFELPNSPRPQIKFRDIETVRNAWGVGPDDICLLSLGGFSEHYGISRFLQAVPRMPREIKIVIHERIKLNSTLRAMADLISAGFNNVRFSTTPVSYDEVNTIAAAGDIGIALYYDEDPNFTLMGKASGKISFYLASGVPVIHENFNNLRWISEAGAGEPAHSPEEILRALEKIQGDLRNYKRRALELFESVVKPDRYLENICRRIACWSRVKQ